MMTVAGPHHQGWTDSSRQHGLESAHLLLRPCGACPSQALMYMIYFPRVVPRDGRRSRYLSDEFVDEISNIH